jgi:hypothetical protein
MTTMCRAGAQRSHKATSLDETEWNRGDRSAISPRTALLHRGYLLHPFETKQKVQSRQVEQKKTMTLE